MLSGESGWSGEGNWYAWRPEEVDWLWRWTGYGRRRREAGLSE